MTSYYTFRENPDITVFPTLRGGVFSFDGFHPSTVGHALIASEIQLLLRDAASRRASKTFGGVSVGEFLDFTANDLLTIYNLDPLVSSCRVQ